MDLQPTRQFDYLQRALSIFISNPSDMSEQFESLIDELIKENQQINKSPKINSPESSSSDSKSDLPMKCTSPQPLPKKRSATSITNAKPPPTKRLKSGTTVKSEDDEEITRKKKHHSEEKLSDNVKDENSNDDDDESNDGSKSKPSESQTNPSSSSRHIDEFAIELGLVCNKCMTLVEEKDNRLVECHECHSKYHQKCHKPPVSTADISDPRCLWYCSKCRKIITKRQLSQTSIKETKTNSNPPISLTKSKATELTGKKGIPSSIADVPVSGLFSFKAKASDPSTLESPTSTHPSTSNSNSSVTNGPTTKNTNGWASLATGFKEKKLNPEVSTNSSASSILSELSALTSSTNSNNPLKRSPSSQTPPVITSSLKPSMNGSLKSTSSSSLSLLKSSKPSSPPPLKPPLSSSSVKSTQKILPTSKLGQRVSSPTPLGRQISTLKSPSPPSSSSSTTTTTSNFNRLNSSGSHSSTSHSPSSTTKIPTGLDYEKRIKQIKKLAAEKSLTKKC